jgi:hypothetical protein
MTENLNALPIWLEVLEYNFKEHTLKGRFLDSKIEINFKLNQVVESQLLKLIDSGKTPKKIRVFIEGSDILALDSEELSENLENLSIEELEQRLKKGYYPKGKIEELSRKLKTELRVKVSSSESGLVLYYNSECTRKISIIALEGEGIGESSEYNFYLRNEGKSDLTEIKLSCENPQIDIMNFPRELKSGEKGEVIIVWTQSSERKALETTLYFGANEIYRAKGVPEGIEVIKGRSLK